MPRPAQFVPAPGPGRRYIDVSTGAIVSYRQRLNAERQAQGFRNEQEFARLSREAKSATSKTKGALGGTDLAAEFRAYAQAQQIAGRKPDITQFLRSYKQAIADRERTKGGAFNQYLIDLGRGNEEEEEPYGAYRGEMADLDREFQRLIEEEEEDEFE